MALTVSRKARETFHIGPDIEIAIIEISPREVRLRISAPKDLRIWQGETLERQDPQESNRRAY